MLKRVSSIHRVLADIGKQYPWQEKLLLAANRSQGHMLLEGLAKAGVPWLNFRPVTITDLALIEVESDLVRRKLRLLTDIEQAQLVGQVLDQLNASNQLVYFTDMYQQGGLETWLVRTISELSLAGVTAEDMAKRVQGAKNRELTLIMAGYEACLENYHLVDTADLLRRAASLAGSQGFTWENRFLLIPDQLELPALAQDFINSLPQSSCIRLLPNRTPKFENGINPNHSTFMAGLPSDTRISAAYGRSNELRTVLRQVIADKLPFDEVLLVYTDSTAYARQSYEILCTYGLPATMAAGVPLDMTAPGRYLQVLLDWVESGYSPAWFYRILANECINLNGCCRESARIWQQLNMGADNARNRFLLNQQQQRYIQEPDLNQDQLAVIRELTEFFSCLSDNLGQVVSTDGSADMGKLCIGLISCLSGYAHRDNSCDQLALDLLLELLPQYQLYYDHPVPLSQALRLLRRVVTEQSVGASGPQPGQLHICHFREGEWCCRPYTFVIGLDADTFPGAGHQDPIMLDEERLKLSERIPLKARESFDKIQRMTRFLSSRPGPVTLVYSCFDPVSFHSSQPASLVLQVYRLISGNAEANYTDLIAALPQPVNYLPHQADKALDDGEWWGNRLLKANKPEWGSPLTRLFPLTTKGIQAEKLRSSSDFTEYDGYIHAWQQEFDFSTGHQVASASSLELAGRCPFAYFLRYLLEVELPPDLEGDPAAWLDPMQKGSLLHDIYCQFGRCQAAGGPAGQTLDDMVANIISEWQRRVPITNQMAFDRTCGEIKNSLPVFLNLFPAANDQYQPMYFEIPFGFSEEEVRLAGAGSAYPVTIGLPGNKSVYLRGRIDRVDYCAQEHRYRIWDYKTGGHHYYQERAAFKQGRHLQPYLYTKAWEALINQGAVPDGRVDGAGYLFPTTRGEGHSILYCWAQDNQGMQVLDYLLTMIGSGSFGCRHNDEECGFCDYAIVCRFPRGCQTMRRKLEYDRSELLQAWKELQKYE